MIRIFLGGTIGIAFGATRLLVAVAHATTPLPPSRLTAMNVAAILGIALMAHGLRYPRRYEG